jgi:hypothetical protein
MDPLGAGRRDHRRPQGHGLHQHIAQSLPHRGEGEHPAARHAGEGVGDETRELDPLRDAQARGQVPEAPPFLALAEDEQPGVPRFSQSGEGAQQGREVLDLA